jgi:uncharacterized 2Fe-2S/4Fe-4S cluster protein (DUF4445 family)
LARKTTARPVARRRPSTRGATEFAFAATGLKKKKAIALETALTGQTAVGGEDVSRVTLAGNGSHNLLDHQTMALEGLVGTVGTFAWMDAGRKRSTPFITGKAFMHRLSAAATPKDLAQTPCSPALTRMPDISRMGERPNISPRAKALVAPAVSSYAGGDAVSGILASRLKSRPGTVVFDDIGGNCEISISRCGKFAAASRAAGPALEGMNVPCGACAQTGAADASAMEDDLSLIPL